MKPAPSSERAFLIHYARVTLAQARVFRARGQMGFKEHYWLGWQARASLHVTYDRSVPQHRTEQT